MSLGEAKVNFLPAPTPVSREHHLSMTLILGLMVCSIGAFSFGMISDIFGRKWAFNLSCLMTSVFGILLVRCLHFLPISLYLPI
jgi:MFS family permease